MTLFCVVGYEIGESSRLSYIFEISTFANCCAGSDFSDCKCFDERTNERFVTNGCEMLADRQFKSSSKCCIFTTTTTTTNTLLFFIKNFDKLYCFLSIVVLFFSILYLVLMC